LCGATGVRLVGDHVASPVEYPELALENQLAKGRRVHLSKFTTCYRSW
jgi:hypothetical protein